MVHRAHERVVSQTPVEVHLPHWTVSLLEQACRHCAGTCHSAHALDVLSSAAGQSEWRLRNLRETLRDNRVFVEGKARSLRVTDERLEAALQHLHAHEARYSGALQAFLARSRGTRRAHEARRRKA